mmetsp:Transcript_13768/g.24743  ORF Transcript_13768/g.24743 Transcript_13768/m.24743 type:complete len:100 (-) Transcript_13768:173-472(-)
MFEATPNTDREAKTLTSTNTQKLQWLILGQMLPEKEKTGRREPMLVESRSSMVNRFDQCRIKNFRICMFLCHFIPTVHFSIIIITRLYGGCRQINGYHY